MGAYVIFIRFPFLLLCLGIHGVINYMDTQTH
jgi:hypothetical protein